MIKYLRVRRTKHGVLHGGTRATTRIRSYEIDTLYYKYDISEINMVNRFCNHAVDDPA